MNILGIHSGFSLGQHDPSAALVIDGQIIAACEEERFTRVKSAYASLPLHSIQHCLRIGKITIHDVELIVHPGQIYPDHRLRLQKYMKHYFGHVPEILMIGHQMAHLASAFFASGFRQSMCLSYDGYGEGLSAALAFGDENGLKILETHSSENSLGVFYSTMTSFLGFRVGEDEYKIMGLAPYGYEEVDLSDFAQPVAEGYIVNNDYILPEFKDATWEEPIYSQKLVKLLGQPRQQNMPITQHHKNIAYATQYSAEKCAIALVKHLYKLTGSQNLCIAGGIGLNCSINRVLSCLPFVRQMFVQPASSDRGLALGCALLGAHNCGDILSPMQHAYLGPEYTEDILLHALKLTGISFHELDDPASTAAEMLAEGEIIGWYQGRSEYGPRALGNRSILADARPREMRDEINRRVKFREEFRPFAPSTLEEEAHNIFDLPYSLPYMTVAVNVRENWQSRIRAVVHINGTARVQTVNLKVTPLYHRLIEQFSGFTGIPTILNTSLNVRGQPIVETPLDALATFAATGLDALFLGPFLVKKTSHPRNE